MNVNVVVACSVTRSYHRSPIRIKQGLQQRRSSPAFSSLACSGAASSFALLLCHECKFVAHQTPLPLSQHIPSPNSCRCSIKTKASLQQADSSGAAGTSHNAPSTTSRLSDVNAARGRSVTPGGLFATSHLQLGQAILRCQVAVHRSRVNLSTLEQHVLWLPLWLAAGHPLMHVRMTILSTSKPSILLYVTYIRMLAQAGA